jgi:hypothetical protein
LGIEKTDRDPIEIEFTANLPQILEKFFRKYGNPLKHSAGIPCSDSSDPAESLFFAGSPAR